MQKVAFFDIDGTVFRSSLLIELVEELIRTEVFPAKAREEYAVSHELWRNREGSYEAYIGDVIRAFMNHIQGVHYGVLADVGRTVVGTQSKRVYRYTRDYITDLKREDYYIVAISQSPKTILDAFCTAYGFDKVYGRMYELGPRDCFTGRVIDEALIQDKSRIIDRLLEHGECTLEGSVGVGDTDGDIPLLSKVATPICFNPNKRLYEHAKEMGWKVVIERKDVIHFL
jgi:HAD superfamily hydrolase (TIGR01490 family)